MSPFARADFLRAQARLKILLEQFDACNTLGSDRAVVSAADAGYPAGMARAATLNTLKRDVSEMCHAVMMEAMRICGMAGYKNGMEFMLGPSPARCDFSTADDQQ